jgi:dTDP-4-dehydrorhamnose 3,5-epimerase
MQIFRGYLEGIVEICPSVISDHRGYFLESYNQKVFEAIIGHKVSFVQDDESYSKEHVLCGLHYQRAGQQGKLVRAVYGEIFDVAVDLRKKSKTFGRWGGVTLSRAKENQLWIPPGFAHGFLALTDTIVLYKVTEYHDQKLEATIRWDDYDLDIQWPLERAPILSARDSQGLRFKEVEYFD